MYHVWSYLSYACASFIATAGLATMDPDSLCNILNARLYSVGSCLVLARFTLMCMLLSLPLYFSYGCRSVERPSPTGGVESSAY